MEKRKEKKRRSQDVISYKILKFGIFFLFRDFPEGKMRQVFLAYAQMYTVYIDLFSSDYIEKIEHYT